MKYLGSEYSRKWNVLLLFLLFCLSHSDWVTPRLGCPHLKTQIPTVSLRLQHSNLPLLLFSFLLLSNFSILLILPASWTFYFLPTSPLSPQFLLYLTQILQSTSKNFHMREPQEEHPFMGSFSIVSLGLPFMNQYYYKCPFCQSEQT